MPVINNTPLFIPSGPSSSFLLHSDTTNGSTTFVDSSSNGLTINTSGSGTQHVTAESKFGASSIEFSGSGHLAALEAGGGLGGNGEFYVGNGDFTVDCWVKPTSVAPNAQVIAAQGYLTDIDELTPFQLRLRTNGSVEAFLRTSSATFGLITTSISLVGTSQFHHIAYTRSGNDFRLFVDGVQSGGTVTSSNTQVNAAGYMALGRRGDGGNAFAGKLDEFRFVVGTAVWTSNFTPPTAPYTT